MAIYMHQPLAYFLKTFRELDNLFEFLCQAVIQPRADNRPT